MLQLGDLNEISVFTHANGGELIVTPMYLGAMDLLTKMRPFPCDGFKVRASDFTNLSLLKEIVDKSGDKPVYISVPHDAKGEVPAVVDGTWQTVFSSNVYTVFCRPEYPPKVSEMNLWKSLQTANGISLHSPDWTLHAIACAFHIGREEARPHEHIKRFYCEVHVIPREWTSVVGETTYLSPLDHEVSISPDDLAKLKKAIKDMEEAIG
jgi:sialic acid synthase SpsE